MEPFPQSCMTRQCMMTHHCMTNHDQPQPSGLEATAVWEGRAWDPPRNRILCTTHCSMERTYRRKQLTLRKLQRPQAATVPECVALEAVPSATGAGRGERGPAAVSSQP